MKENLVCKLDLLESQIHGESTNPRLARTKYALEKLNKKTKNDGESRHGLLEQTKAVKQEIVRRKVHHGIIEVNRSLKRALQIEALKIRRRIKKLPESDAHKKQILIAELDLLQNDAKFKKERLADTLIYSSIKKAFMKLSTPDFIGEDLQQKCLKNDVSSFTPPENNVFARIRNEKTVKAAITDMTQSIDAVINRKPKEQKAKEKESVKDAKTDKVVEVHQEESENDDDDDMDEYHDAVANDSESSDDEDEDQDSEDEEEALDVKKSKKKAANIDDDGDFFETNLPELATGYYSGSEDEDNYDYDNDKTVREITSERKNRRGQRARRKIWEAKYGSGAKHIAKERDEQKAKREQRQLEYEQREAARREKRKRAGIPEDGAVPDSTNHNRSEARRAPTDKSSQSNTPLHPSWQAKKQQKQAKFEGKKIKFD